MAAIQGASRMTRPTRAVFGAVLLSMALVLSACSDSEDSSSAPKTENGTTGITGRNIKVAFSAPTADHGWTGAISTMAKAEAAKHNDIDFSLTQAPNAADQVSQINTIIAQKPDVLVVLP